MCRVLAGRYCAVMTGAAGTQHLRMVYRVNGHPDIRVMAVFANIGCLNMREALAGGFDTVVTTDTVAGDSYVIEIGRQPASRRVTIVTISAARDMCGVFAGCSNSVMTGAAAAQHLCVIYRIHGCPHVAVVAVLTDVRCLNVGQILARRVQPIVAAYAIARDVQVVEGRRPPCNCRVAIVAGFATDEVCRVLASRYYAIVTGVAGADDLRMVNGKYGRKYVGVMAVLANIAGLNMLWILANRIHAVMAVNTGTGDV